MLFSTCDRVVIIYSYSLMMSKTKMADNRISASLTPEDKQEILKAICHHQTKVTILRRV
ncbi:MAG: hypothetical protein F6K35_28725 [Okeania sp. SIO2H7]|nr:hypothetical protein [Okeania sp. SIO2H7]